MLSKISLFPIGTWYNKGTHTRRFQPHMTSATALDPSVNSAKTNRKEWGAIVYDPSRILDQTLGGQLVKSVNKPGVLCYAVTTPKSYQGSAAQPEVLSINAGLTLPVKLDHWLKACEDPYLSELVEKGVVAFIPALRKPERLEHFELEHALAAIAGCWSDVQLKKLLSNDTPDAIASAANAQLETIKQIQETRKAKSSS